MMSDVANQGSAQLESGSAADVLNSNTKDSVSYETHRRILAQRKKDQEYINELEKFRDNVDLEKKELEGRKDEVISELKNKLNESESKTLNLVRNLTKKTVKDEIAKEALSKGLQREKLPKFLKLTEDSFFNNQETPIQVDEHFNIVNKDVFSSILEKEVSDNSDWFIKTASGPNDVIPEQKPMAVPEKGLEDKSVDELAQML